MRLHRHKHRHFYEQNFRMTGSNTQAHQLPLLRCEVEIIFRVTVNKAKVILDWILCFTKEKSMHISIHDVSMGGIVLRT